MISSTYVFQSNFKSKMHINVRKYFSTNTRHILPTLVTGNWILTFWSWAQLFICLCWWLKFKEFPTITKHVPTKRSSTYPHLQSMSQATILPKIFVHIWTLPPREAFVITKNYFFLRFLIFFATFCTLVLMTFLFLFGQLFTSRQSKILKHIKNIKIY